METSTKNNKTNNFRIKLCQENILFYERIFNADQFNPFTRYSVDIRDIMRDIIGNLQKQMSKSDIKTTIKYDNNSYNLIEMGGKFVDKYNPKNQTKYVEDVDVTLKGVKCKIGLYINEHPIIERDFYVDRFNPHCRWSIELTNTMDNISYYIYKLIKETDIKNTWDDHDMIHLLGYDFVQIMEFTPEMRASAIRRLNRR